jgi:hypothetical protein
MFIGRYQSRSLQNVKKYHPSGKARRLGAYLPPSLTNALNRRSDEGLQLRQAWLAAIPEPLVSHAHPVRYTAGLLFVHADSPAWAGRLRHEQSTFMAALKRVSFLRDLTDLRVRVVPLDAGPLTKAASPRPMSRLSANAANVVEQSAATISDPDLRAALQRLAQRGDAASPKRQR